MKDKIKEQDTLTINQLYFNNLPKFEAFVLKKNGSKEDAEDIFQNAMIIIYEKCRNDFHFTKGIEEYLLGICKKLWFKNFNSIVNKNDDTKSIEDTLTDDFIIYELFEEANKKRLYLKYLKMLPESCQAILKLSFKKYTINEISKILGFTSIYIRKRKSICKKKLFDSIASDPIYNELTE